MKTLNQSLQERMQDSEFRRYYEYENIIQNIALRIAKIRQELGISQADLAKKLGTKQQVISRIEGGNQNLSVQMLLKISEALGAKINIELSKT